MSKNESERFKEIYEQGKVSSTSIIVDTETGVQYLFKRDGYGGGMTVLVDADGKPLLYKQ